MFACVDVAYSKSTADAACILFRDWTDAAGCQEHVVHLTEIAPYESGQFFRRELPCIQAVIQPFLDSIDTLLIDGYVWLKDNETPGLGAKLYQALNEQIAIVGIAKNRFHQTNAAELCRGNSDRPLYVTAVGIQLDVALEGIKRMHGRYRIPTLLKKVDRLCRQAASSGT